jgi:hypothetical protein
VDKDIFGKIKQKTNISEQQIKAVASSIKPGDLKDEKKVRALVQRIAAMVGVPFPKEKEDQIVNMFVNQKIDPQQMMSVIQMFVKPKK